MFCGVWCQDILVQSLKARYKAFPKDLKTLQGSNILVVSCSCVSLRWNFRLELNGWYGSHLNHVKYITFVLSCVNDWFLAPSIIQTAMLLRGYMSLILSFHPYHALLTQPSTTKGLVCAPRISWRCRISSTDIHPWPFMVERCGKWLCVEQDRGKIKDSTQSKLDRYSGSVI